MANSVTVELLNMLSMATLFLPNKECSSVTPTATYMASAFIPSAVAGLTYGLVKCLRERARSNLSDNAPDLEAPALVNRGHNGLSFHINGYHPTTVTINNVTYVQAECAIQNPTVSYPILSATPSTPQNYQTFPQAAIA